MNSYKNHKELIAFEKDRFPPVGKMIEINEQGDRIHLYSEGTGDKALVFLSWLGTFSPYYDFKPLFTKLSDKYKIIVIERAGYWWSDITDSSRNIDNVLDEARKVLKLANIDWPYILLPHSMAGLKSIYWANSYPDEVEMIIWLDPLVPGYHEVAQEKPSFSRLTNFLVDTGLVRNRPEVFYENFHAKSFLDKFDIYVAKTLFYRRVQTDNMWNEIEYLDKNASLVSKNNQIQIPFHAFISSENEDDYWKQKIVSYSKNTGGKNFILDGGHYIHLDFPEYIAKKSKNLIEGN